MRFLATILHRPSRPWLEGACVAALLFAATALCTVAVYLQAHEAQVASLRAELQRLVRQSAALIPPDKHLRLQHGGAQDQALYQELIEPLVQFHLRAPDIFYVYTVVPDGTRVRFLLDTMSQAPRLQRTPNPLAPRPLDVYAQPHPLLLRTLQRGTVEANSEPYADEFGEFVSAFAPLVGPEGRVIGAAAIDLDAHAYRERLEPIRQTAATAVIISLLLSSVIGAGIAWFRRIASERERQRLLAEAGKQEHERSRRLLDGVLNASVDAVIAVRAVRDPQGRIVDFAFVLMNAIGERVAGRTAAELVGTRLLELFPQAAGHPLFTGIVGVVENGGSLDVEEYFSADAFWPWCRVVAVKLGDGAAITISNITTRKVAEEELIRAKEGAEAADRAKGEFLAVVSHEIRTPMNGVIGFTTVLQDTPLNAEQQEYVRTIRRSSETLLALINEILDFSKIEAGAVELEALPFRIREAIEDCVQINSQTASSRGLTLDVEVHPDVPEMVIGDSARLQQVLINLIGNALKFTSRGTVWVRASIAEPTTEDTAADALRLRFQVRDQGIGIPPEKISQLFRPFTQADSSTTRLFGGTGLGLAICKRLCQLMGGDITVESEVGIGSTFTFTLAARRTPSISSPTAARTELPKSQDNIPPARAVKEPAVIHLDPVPLSILVVEDNPVNQRVVELLLRRKGYVAAFAVNGREAVRKWLTESPDLILMDVQMPEMDGYAATTEIRQLEAFLPGRIPVYICALTADAMRGDRQRCLDCGMDDYMSKPIAAQRLCEVIRRAVEHRAFAVAQTEENAVERIAPHSST